MTAIVRLSWERSQLLREPVEYLCSVFEQGDEGRGLLQLSLAAIPPSVSASAAFRFFVMESPLF